MFSCKSALPPVDDATPCFGTTKHLPSFGTLAHAALSKCDTASTNECLSSRSGSSSADMIMDCFLASLSSNQCPTVGHCTLARSPSFSSSATSDHCALNRSVSFSSTECGTATMRSLSGASDDSSDTHTASVLHDFGAPNFAAADVRVIACAVQVTAAITFAKYLADNSIEVRREAAKQLKMLGPAVQPVARSLQPALSDPCFRIRYDVAEALANAKGEGLAVLEETALRGTPCARHTAIRTLRARGLGRAELYAGLHRDADESVRLAAGGLAELGDVRGLPVIADTLHSERAKLAMPAPQLRSVSAVAAGELAKPGAALNMQLSVGTSIIHPHRKALARGAREAEFIHTARLCQMARRSHQSTERR